MTYRVYVQRTDDDGNCLGYCYSRRFQDRESAERFLIRENNRARRFARLSIY